MLRVLPGTRLAMRAFGLCASLALTACAAPPPPPELLIDGIRSSEIVPGYGRVEDGDYVLPVVPPGYLQGVNRRATVAYAGDAEPGTIEVDPYAKFLYWVETDGTAIRYPIAVGREGRGIGGSFTIRRKAEWPGWTPTANMLRREPEVYGPYRGGVPGGPESPLGARALYLYRGGADSYYRIHGTNDLSSIGNSGSAGCIRLFNQDAVDLFERVPEGTRVVIRSREDSLRIEGPLMVERGVQLPPFYTGEGQRPPVPQAMVPEAYYGNPAAQTGVAYVPDPTDIYTESGFVAGGASAAAPAAGSPAPILSQAEILAPQGGVEMVGAGFSPAPG